MSRHIRNIEVAYDILVEVRKIFRDLNGDSIVALNKMARLVKRIDDILEEHKDE
jgi:hypothetical protein